MKYFKTIILLKYTRDKVLKSGMLDVIRHSIEYAISIESEDLCSQKYDSDTHAIVYTYTVPDNKTPNEINQAIRKLLADDITYLATIPINKDEVNLNNKDETTPDIFDLLYN